MPTMRRKTWLAERRKRFRQALLESEITLTEFCELHDYSRNHLHEVLAGRRESRRLDELLAGFVLKELGVEL